MTSTVTTGQYTLSYSAPNITSVAITPGSYSDWVGAGSVDFTLVTAVPEAGTWTTISLGLALIGCVRRRLTSKTDEAL